jgi:hypothetical protein
VLGSSESEYCVLVMQTAIFRGPPGELFELDFATVGPELFEILLGDFEFTRYGLNGKKSLLHEG